MADVTSTVNINLPKLNQLNTTAVKALEMTTQLLLTEIKNAEVMPFDTGNLQNESTFTDFDNSHQGETSIVSNTVYARRLYYHPEYNFKRDFNANAGGEWFNAWLKGGSMENYAKDTFKAIYKRANDL